MGSGKPIPSIYKKHPHVAPQTDIGGSLGGAGGHWIP